MNIRHELQLAIEGAEQSVDRELLMEARFYLERAAKFATILELELRGDQEDNKLAAERLRRSEQ